MFSSCLRCLKSGKMRPADSFWSSRARVVHILQEELNRFLKENIMSYFRVQIVFFHNPSFSHNKTEVRGPKSCPQDVIIGLGRALLPSSRGPLGQSRGVFWVLLGAFGDVLGSSWGFLGFLGLHQRPRQHDKSLGKPKRGEGENH